MTQKEANDLEWLSKELEKYNKQYLQIKEFKKSGYKTFQVNYIMNGDNSYVFKLNSKNQSKLLDYIQTLIEDEQNEIKEEIKKIVCD